MHIIIAKALVCAGTCQTLLNEPKAALQLFLDGHEKGVRIIVAMEYFSFPDGFKENDKACAAEITRATFLTVVTACLRLAMINLFGKTYDFTPQNKQFKTTFMDPLESLLQARGVSIEA